jgi:hypothetical protein
MYVFEGNIKNLKNICISGGNGMDKKKKKLIFLSVLIILIIVLISFMAKPSFKTVEAVSSDYENKVSFEGIYFTDEYVVYKNEVVTSQLKVKDGTKVPKGMNIYDGINAIEAGILCTHLDGYENNYDVNNIMNANSDDIKKIIRNNELKQGIKIINNSEWYVYAMVDKNTNFKKRRVYDLLINNNYYPGKILNIKNDSKFNLILFRVENDLNTLNLHRGINGYIIETRYNGIVVPNKAVVTINGVKGVFIKTHGYAEFRKVNVSFEGNNIAIILPKEKGKKLQNFDSIICDPGTIKDGTKIREWRVYYRYEKFY